MISKRGDTLVHWRPGRGSNTGQWGPHSGLVLRTQRGSWGPSLQLLERWQYDGEVKVVLMPASPRPPSTGAMPATPRAGPSRDWPAVTPRKARAAPPPITPNGRTEHKILWETLQAYIYLLCSYSYTPTTRTETLIDHIWLCSGWVEALYLQASPQTHLGILVSELETTHSQKWSYWCR